MILVLAALASAAPLPVQELPPDRWTSEQDPRTAWGIAGEGRVRWRLSSDLPPADHAAIEVRTCGAWEVRADGQPIGARRGTGPIIAPPVAIPDALLADGHLDLELDVTFDLLALPACGRLRGARIGDATLLAAESRADTAGAEARLAWRWSVAAAAGLLGLAHAVISLRRPDLPGMRSFAIGALALCGVGLWDAPTNLGLGGPLPLHRPVLLALVAVAYDRLFASTAEILRGPRWIPALVGGLMYTRSAGMILLPREVGIPMSNALALAAAAVVVGSLGWWLVRGVREAVPGARTLGIAGIVFAVCSTASISELAGMPHNPWISALGELGTPVMVLGAAWALSIDRVLAALGDLEDAYRASRRFVPAEFLARVGKRNFREVQRGDAVRERMTVLFLDLRDFTTLAERTAPEALFSIVNGLLDAVEPHVRAHGGFLTSHTGDGFAALFPTAEGGVSAAVAMQAEIDRLSALPGAVPLRAGIGVHTGPILLGTVGGGTYLTVGMVGDPVNTAARVEGTTKRYGVRVMVSADALAEVSAGRFATREVDRVVLKGRAAPIGLHQVLEAEPPAVRAALDPTAFAQARALYAAGRFAEAREAFAALHSDPAAAVLAERARGLAAAPPEGWDGVWRLDEK